MTVLEMRNQPEVQSWMYTQTDIPRINHLQFIENLIGDRKSQYFLVHQDEQAVGVIYFNDIDNEEQTAMLGIYTNQLEPKRGTGGFLIKLAMFYAKKLLILKSLELEVFSNNTRAKKLYEKHGFEEQSRKQQHDITVLSMNLEL